MAKLIYGMSQSLDGYVDNLAGTLEIGAPDAGLIRHFHARVRGLAGSLYGRGVYGMMQYWDADRPEWDADQRAFAAAWRANPKWVASRTLTEVGPNATLIRDDLEGAVRRLKAEVDGDIEVGGPTIAAALTALGLIDEYHLYFLPIALGAGKPFFAGPTPQLRLVAADRIGDGSARLIYVPS